MNLFEGVKPDNLMGMNFIKLIALYILLPTVTAGLILWYLKANGKIIGIVATAVSLIGLYFMVMNGLK
ncbi:hypothetical protein [Paenibacillus brevis]|uniref:Uncharacterized protein n=1 Tax=Paenibacillus brevis TaxID=2841508 RepID=A0ABS6FR80_9BACL|nr:hypothetical protein [Paenibacillus brevis]MBU5672629.1 hypothetical protein [Paenibacillus brevis]